MGILFADRLVLRLVPEGMKGLLFPLLVQRSPYVPPGSQRQSLTDDIMLAGATIRKFEPKSLSKQAKNAIKRSGSGKRSFKSKAKHKRR